MRPAEVQIIADSVSPDDIRLTTFQLRYWRPIHSELMTHRVFSRNAGSSRARPSKAIIEQVRRDPWGPLHWGANQPGMQAHNELDEQAVSQSKANWHIAAKNAAEAAEAMLEINVHKQVVNRLLEPFTYIDVVLTATDFANWFALRDHPDAQPEIQDLARRMKQVMDGSVPALLQPGEWHLPYIEDEDWEVAHVFLKQGRITRDEPPHEEKLELLKRISVASCARVSYKAFDGSRSPFEKDLALCEQLLVSEPLHASPAEHQATPDTKSECDHTHYTESDHSREMSCGKWDNQHLHGNLRGWIQYRKTLPNEFVEG